MDAQSNDGMTALGFAAAAGYLDIVNMLSQQRAKVNTVCLLRVLPTRCQTTKNICSTHTDTINTTNSEI